MTPLSCAKVVIVANARRILLSRNCGGNWTAIGKAKFNKGNSQTEAKGALEQNAQTIGVSPKHLDRIAVVLWGNAANAQLTITTDLGKHWIQVNVSSQASEGSVIGCLFCGLLLEGPLCAFRSLAGGIRMAPVTPRAVFLPPLPLGQRRATSFTLPTLSNNLPDLV